MANVIEGTVKWFSNVKGYGFIVDESGNDYLAHHSEIDMDGYRKLTSEQKVSFTPKSTERGLAATMIKPQ